MGSELPQRETRRAIAGVALLVLLGAVLRCIQMTGQSLWLDEGWSLHFSDAASLDQTFSRILEHNGGERYQPLYLLCLHGWIRVFGDSDLAIRFPSALFGTLLIPVVLLLGRELFDQATGTVAAGLAAVSSFGCGTVRMRGRMAC